MAKIRVYELAKKLNMTNRALLLKLEAMNIEVKSHMSSLEDDTVAQIKETLFGKKDRNSEKRVRPSVIRRRKKTNKNESDDDPSDAEEMGDAVESFDTDPSDDAPEGVAVLEDENGVESHALNEDTLSDDPSDDTPAVDGPEVSSEIKDEPTQNIPGVNADIFRKKKKSVESARIIRPASPPVVTDTAADQPDAAAVDCKERDGKGVKMAPDTGGDEQKHEPTQAEAVSSPKDLDDTGADDGVDTPLPSDTSAASVDTFDEDDNRKEAHMPKDLEMQDGSKNTDSDDAVSPQDTADEEASSIDDTHDDKSAVAKRSAHEDDGDSADKKKKKKKKMKKSEPAKIIKLAVPIPTAKPKPKRSGAGDRPAAGGRPQSAATESAPRNVRGAQKPSPAAGVGFPPPAVPSDKDDLKSKRKKGKVKKKRRGDENVDTEAKGAPKKRKSVVEGKDLYDGGYSGKKGRRKDGRGKRAKAQKTQITVPKAIKRRIKIDETIELSELAKRMSIKANEMIVKLMGMGVMATVNQTIDYDTAALVAAEFEYEVERAAAVEDVLLHVHEEENPEDLIARSPVVTIMGHVDHGKTSLLDVIRKSKITTGEAGGITQHIGAYSVETPNGGVVTFLDTPGHEAFTSMRSRGAQVTDIVVLVVAADDGVMPQTVEAINHSKAANVPVVVAVNKMDKPDADPDRVTRELAEHGLLSEDWGGDVIFVRVSAKTEEGIEQLLEMILLQAEVLELKANPTRLAIGHVVEARLDAGRGPVATVLVQQGTLKASEPVVCGLHAGKIRAMISDMGENIDSAGPSTPVEIVGLSGVPDAGDEFVALASEKDAKQISENRMQKERAKELAKKSRANLEKLFANMGADEIKELKLLIKADVHGSLEALNESLMKLVQDEVDIKVVHSGIGAINESDVSLAAVSDAIIIGFNVRPSPKVREMAKEENVDMRFYDIIYNVINDIKAALTGLMPSTFHEKVLGRAEVRDTFVIPSRGTIAGCFVQDGKVTRGVKARLLREGVVKCDSVIGSLRRFKEDAKEVSQGYECGIGIEKYNDIKLGDIIECYEIEERKASIDSLKE